jgi:hypothetical protein
LNHLFEKLKVDEFEISGWQTVAKFQPVELTKFEEVEQIYTVKASNFGPHGNFGLFLASSVASMDELCTQNEQNRICRSKVFPQLLFSSFFCRTRFNDSKPF